MAHEKIMLIDDDESVHELMRRLFEGAGYEFVSAFGGEEGLAALPDEKPDLLLLDVMMPTIDGYEVCRQIRGQGRRVPIIFLTAKGDIVDKRTGFKAGGDDYVVKPFNSEELMLRVEAMLRRRADELAFAKAVQREGVLSVGDLEISFSAYEAYLRGERLDLTSREFEILALLASNPGQVFTRAQIFEHVWGREEEVDQSSITVFIHKIREKLEDDPSDPRYIQTVWRVGYKFAERV